MALDGTVKIPLVGTVKKKWALGGAVILAVILGVAYYRHSRNASPAAAASTTTGTQDPNAIDPATGLTYAEEAAGIQSGTLAGYGSAYGDTSGIVGYDAQGNPIYADQVGYGPTPSYVNNAAWAQAAEQYLVGTTGADAGTVAAALGVYLTGQTLSSAQASVVQSAIGFFGRPPDQGPDGYPPALRLGAPPSSTVSVPDVVGDAAGDAHNKIVAAGLVPIADPGQKPHDKVTSTSPRGGTHVAQGSQVLITASGQQTVTVPDVVGQPIDRGGPAITAAGLRYSGPAPVPGHIVYITSQTPAAGSQVPAGTLVRCAGSDQTSYNDVTVPDVVGHKAGDAHNILARAGLIPVDPNAKRRGEPQRIVGSQSPGARTRVASGTRVTINVR